MPKVLRYLVPVVACLMSSSGGTPAGGEGTAGSRARAIHAARAPKEVTPR